MAKMKAAKWIALMSIGMMGLTACEWVEQKGTVEDSPAVVPPPNYDVIGDPEPTPGEDDNNTPVVIPPETDVEEGFFINDGALRTKDALLELKLITLNRNGMKITFNFNCEGGEWENYAGAKRIQSPLLNQSVPVSVQFRDWDNRIGPCYRQSIIHDLAGPEIVFSKYPLASLEEGSLAQVIFDVKDKFGEVKNVVCSLNGLEKPCLSGRNEVNISALPVGDYTFSVRASDDLDNASEASVSWKVVSLSRRLTQSIRVNDLRKVDILFVIDNSGSMEYEQRNMAQRTSNFMSILRGLDYQIAVTTTDPESRRSWGDGRLLDLTGGSAGQKLITTSIAESNAQALLSNTLQRSETGSGSEQGIRAAHRVIDRYVASESSHRAFFRDGAHFAVVLISDEDESANADQNDPEKLISHVRNTFNGQKMFGYHSIITKPGDTACRSTNGAAYGERYKAISELTGGVIGSVCEQDYSAQVAGIAEGIRNLLKTMTLQCQPLQDRPIVIMKDGVVITPSYVIDGLSLKFSAELDAGDYSVSYHCLNQN